MNKEQQLNERRLEILNKWAARNQKNKWVQRVATIKLKQLFKGK